MSAWEQTDVLLLQKGRTLSPASRRRYRWVRVRAGRSITLEQPDAFVGVVGLVVRLITIPFLAGVDLLLWPLARVTVARGKWFVVALRFNGPDAAFDRVAEADTLDEIKVRKRELERATP